MTTRKFYRTTFTITVISEGEYNPRFRDIYYDITDGEFSGVFQRVASEELTPLQAATALLDQGSDPEWLYLDAEGNDLPELDVDKDNTEPEGESTMKMWECECNHPDCNEQFPLTVQEYIDASKKGYVRRPGCPADMPVIERTDRYLISPFGWKGKIR